MASTGLREPVFYGDFSFNTGKLKRFHALDYIIFATVLILSAVIGFYFAYKDRQKKTLEQFFMAGRNMKAGPVSLSLLASFMSAITLLGTPAEVYSYNTMYFWIGLSYPLVMAGAAYIYIPIFYHLKVTSAYELLYISIVLYAPSLALNAVTGFSLWGSIISVGLVCTFYTAVGGMKAVLWADCFQVVVMVLSLLAVVIKGSQVVGGLDVMWESAHRTNRILWDDIRLDPTVRHTVWGLVFGSYFTWVAIFGVNQAQVQRACTCATLKDAQIAMWLNVPGLCVILYVCCFAGLLMSAFYENCDPIRTKYVSNTNQILPMFVMDVLGDVAGLPGLFVAGLFSGALSTISSGLNSMAAAVLEDIILRYFQKNMKQAAARRLSQTLSIVFGLICLALTYVASKLGNLLQAALTLFGVVGGPLLGLFSLGMFFPWANNKGAVSGLIGSIFIMLWIAVGAQLMPVPREKALTFTTNCNRSVLSNATWKSFDSDTPRALIDKDDIFYLYKISYLWLSTMSVTLCISIGLAISFITGATDPKSLNPKLICPLADVMFPFFLLPESIRRSLRVGIEHQGKYDPKVSRTPHVSIEEGQGEEEGENLWSDTNATYDYEKDKTSVSVW